MKNWDEKMNTEYVLQQKIVMMQESSQSIVFLYAINF